MATVSVSAVAQEEEKKAHSNIFVGAGIGAMSVFNDGMNSPTLNINVQVGKYINPVWGVRGVLSGAWQSLETQNYGYSDYCKKFVELNMDAMINLNSLFGNKNYNRTVDVYLFGGPTLNIASAVSGQINYIDQNGGNYTPDFGEDVNVNLKPEYAYASDGAKMRVGATIGLGAAYNINNKWAVNLEARMGVTPSIFGMGSDCRKAEATGRLNVGFAYTFGGKDFTIPAEVDREALNAEVNKYRDELAQAQQELVDSKNAMANMKPEVKEVVKVVEAAGARAIFFKIGSAKIDDYGRVNLELAAKALKANPDRKYKIAGYCDKATGSVSGNQKLSEKRAQAVYDALVNLGVDKDQLELVGFGGTENMFGKNALNRVVILE